MISAGLLQSAAMTTPMLAASAVVQPLFEAGPVRFFQAADITTPLEPFATEQTSYGLHLLSNERYFQDFYPAIDDIGGVVFGVGGFQNLNFAAVSLASGLIMTDMAPNVALTMTMLLPRIPEHATASDFLAEVHNLLTPGAPKEHYLRDIPVAYKMAFSCHIDNLRSNRINAMRLQRFLSSYSVRPETFLGNKNYYERVAQLIAGRSVAVIYGSIFSLELPQLVEGAMSVFSDPIRTVYLSNAPERAATTSKNSIVSPGFESFLSSDAVDPHGRVLMTTEFGTAPSIMAVRRDDSFTYHARSIRESRFLLVQAQSINAWVRSFKREPMISHSHHSESSGGA